MLQANQWMLQAKAKLSFDNLLLKGFKSLPLQFSSYNGFLSNHLLMYSFLN